MLKQPTFYPIAMVAQHATGRALEPLVNAPEYDTKLFGGMPLLDVSASYDEAAGRGAVFLVNRSQTEAVTTEVVWRGAAPGQAVAIHQVAGNDPKAINTFERPDVVVSRELGGEAISDGKLTLKLPPLSFTAVVTAGYGDSRES